MLTFMPTCSVALTASPSALREGALRNSSPFVSEASEDTTRVETALDEQPNQASTPPHSGRIGRIGSLQSPSNPHTSTALAA
jgi:hypothetical protein